MTKGIKNPKLILNNNEFFFHKLLKNKSRWRCTGYYKTKCKAALFTYGKVVQLFKEHNHPDGLATTNGGTLMPYSVVIIDNKT